MPNDRRTLTGGFLEQLDGSDPDGEDVKPFERLRRVVNMIPVSVAFVQVEPDKEYEFKFKFKKQYLIDEKYPTIVNEFNSQNNVIITYS
jgi:hypothetical protein